MPLYFFHIRNGDKVELDPDGTVLPDEDAAAVEARRVVRELVCEVSDLRRDAILEVADAAGRTLLTLPFADAIRPH